jgi:hypothetical protein
MKLCFLREAPERAIESDRRPGKWGLFALPVAEELLVALQVSRGPIVITLETEMRTTDGTEYTDLKAVAISLPVT